MYTVLYFHELKKINTTFIRNVWFSVSNITQSFRFRIVSKLLKSENCLWRFSTKFRFSFSLSRKIFRLQFSLIFLRKNRSEAFCVSSENTLYTTFRGLKMWRKTSTKPTQIYTKLYIKQLCHCKKIPKPAIFLNRCCRLHNIFGT